MFLKYEDFLLEKRELKFGCLMVFFDFPEMNNIHSMIEEKDIYDEEGFGLEDKPHTTLLYGFEDDKINRNDIFESIKDIEMNNLILSNASLFENDYDVLKFDVRSEMETEKYDKNLDPLFKINKLLTSKFPYQTDYPDYHPHSTIAYINKGKGTKYVDMFKDREFVVIPKLYVYSFDGEKIEREI